MNAGPDFNVVSPDLFSPDTITSLDYGEMVRRKSGDVVVGGLGRGRGSGLKTLVSQSFLCPANKNQHIFMIDKLQI